MAERTVLGLTVPQTVSRNLQSDAKSGNAGALRSRNAPHLICYLRSLIELMILLARPYSIASEADIQ
jgi:hypothetical protein